jgi:hypothetical protein
MFSLQSSIERMGSNFLVAGLVPSLGFVVSVAFTVEPIIPRKIASHFGFNSNPISQLTLLIIVPTLILGFTLTSLNTFFIKIFEGYILLPHIPAINRIQQRKFRKQKRQLIILRKKINRFSKRDGEAAKKAISKLNEKERALVTEYQRTFPLRENELLPTRFGNILKAAEAYPMERYKIDAVPLWTRIVHVIPPSYDSRIEHTHNELTFLINCAILSAIFSVITFFAAGYQLLLSLLSNIGKQSPIYLIQVDLPGYIYFQRTLMYLALGLIAILAAIIFNRASLLTVDDFGHLIRSVYDLFRFDLLRQLHLKLPEDSDEDLDIWTRISYFINVGYQLEERAKLKPIIYVHSEQIGNKESESPGADLDNNKGQKEQID